LKKITAEKKLIFYWIKSYNLPIPRPPYRTPKLQEKPSALKKEHPALQNMKILYFFLFFWIIFPLLDPDPDPATQINADPCGSGYGSRSETLDKTIPTTLILETLLCLVTGVFFCCEHMDGKDKGENGSLN
jgi:hypothetical protein